MRLRNEDEELNDPGVDRLAPVSQLAEAEQQEFLALALTRALTPQRWQAPTCAPVSSDSTSSSVWRGVSKTTTAAPWPRQPTRAALEGPGKSVSRDGAPHEYPTRETRTVARKGLPEDMEVRFLNWSAA